MTGATLLTSAWSFRPLVLLACAAALALHGARGGFASGRRTSALLVAVAVLLIALVSPVDALAGGYLFSAHMFQHLLLVLVVPPLVLMALPDGEEGTQAAHADRAAAWLLAHPAVTWGSGIGAMWLWHEQTLCSAAAQSDMIRGLQSVSLVTMGALFYWPLLAPRASWRMRPLSGMAYLFSACIGCSVLGILITFSPVTVCPAFLHPVDPQGMLGLIRDRWGISAAEDQKIAGLLMWVPACTIYGSGILGMLGRFFAGEQTRATR